MAPTLYGPVFFLVGPGHLPRAGLGVFAGELARWVCCTLAVVGTARLLRVEVASVVRVGGGDVVGTARLVRVEVARVLRVGGGDGGGVAGRLVFFLRGGSSSLCSISLECPC